MASKKALIFEKLDIAIYPLDSTIGFSNTYPLDSDLAGGEFNPMFEQLGPAH